MAIMLKNLNPDWIHERKSRNGNTFYSVSFRTSRAESGWAYFTFYNKDNILPGDEPGKKNILLSDDDNGTIQISYRENGEYKRDVIPASEIGEYGEHTPVKKDSQAGNQPQEHIISATGDPRPAILYRIPAKWVHKRVGRNSGKEFYSVGIPEKEAESGWGNITIWERKQFRVHQNKDGSKDNRFVDIKLSNDDNDIIRINIRKDGKYVNIEKTASQIVHERVEEQRAYMQQRDASQQAQPVQAQSAQAQPVQVAPVQPAYSKSSEKNYEYDNERGIIESDRTEPDFSDEDADSLGVGDIPYYGDNHVENNDDNNTDTDESTDTSDSDEESILNIDENGNIINDDDLPF